MKLPQIHQLINEMGCKRHEVHPMYASSFASHLPMVSLDELRASIHRLLDSEIVKCGCCSEHCHFFACNELEEDEGWLSVFVRNRM